MIIHYVNENTGSVTYNRERDILQCGSILHDGDGHCVLCAPLLCSLVVNGVRHEVQVPTGFTSDGLTIPLWIRPVAAWFGIRPFCRYLPAAVLHDWLAAHAKTDAQRRTADAVFRQALWVMRVSWYHRQILYRCVRLGSRFPALYETH